MPSYSAQRSFYDDFNENMEALGLSAPNSLFSTQDKVVGAASTIVGAITKLGRDATLLEIIGATTMAEKLIVVGALSASYYAGAAIGSLAVATGRRLAGGTTLTDVMWTAMRNDIDPPWLQVHLLRNPCIYDSRWKNNRASYGLLARLITPQRIRTWR
jgi:hypothetical protein